jgi:hypothetical protein
VSKIIMGQGALFGNTFGSDFWKFFCHWKQRPAKLPKILIFEPIGERGPKPPRISESMLK